MESQWSMSYAGGCWQPDLFASLLGDIWMKLRLYGLVFMATDTKNLLAHSEILALLSTLSQLVEVLMVNLIQSV